MEIVLTLAGVVAGAAIGWWIGRSKSDAEIERHKAAAMLEQEKVRQLQLRTEALTKEVESERARVLHVNNQLAATEANYRNLQEKLSERQKEVESLQDKFTAEFKNLANEILERNSAK